MKKLTHFENKVGCLSPDIWISFEKLPSATIKRPAAGRLLFLNLVFLRLKWL